jgi:hypothetical protein
VDLVEGRGRDDVDLGAVAGDVGVRDDLPEVLLVAL